MEDNMALQEKYAELVGAATAAGVANLQVREQDGVLYIDGDAATAEVKEQLWDIYEKLDPDFRSADVVMNITAPATTNYTVKGGDSLSKIGKKFGKTWQEIYNANVAVIGDNPDHIEVGMDLQIP
jgi:nucleoid-associated protein YgaU